MQLYSWNASPCILRKPIANVKNEEPNAVPPGAGDWVYGPRSCGRERGIYAQPTLMIRPGIRRYDLSLLLPLLVFQMNLSLSSSFPSYRLEHPVARPDCLVR